MTRAFPKWSALFSFQIAVRYAVPIFCGKRLEKFKSCLIKMGSNFNQKIIILIFLITILGCSRSPDLSTPERIGDKERVREIIGKQAARVVDKMHGLSVAAHANVIAEYGRDKKDLLFISRYGDQTEAHKAFALMIEKMAAAKKGPFFHLMPLGQYDNKVYMTLGMGAIHYIYVSGNSLLWLQTYQSFKDKLPARLLELYPL